MERGAANRGSPQPSTLPAPPLWRQLGLSLPLSGPMGWQGGWARAPLSRAHRSQPLWRPHRETLPPPAIGLLQPPQSMRAVARREAWKEGVPAAFLPPQSLTEQTHNQHRHRHKTQTHTCTQTQTTHTDSHSTNTHINSHTVQKQRAIETQKTETTQTHTT